MRVDGLVAGKNQNGKIGSKNGLPLTEARGSRTLPWPIF